MNLSREEKMVLITQKLIPLVKVDLDFDDTSCIEFWADENY